MDPEIDFLKAPAFIPQPPPPGLGVLRSIVLALMVLVGMAEGLLAAAAALGLFSGTRAI